MWPLLLNLAANLVDIFVSNQIKRAEYKRAIEQQLKRSAGEASDAAEIREEYEEIRDKLKRK
jgi:hypothetical protein